MCTIGKTALAILAAALTTGVAAASDVLSVSTSGAEVASVPVHDGSSYDWSGFYAGIFTGIQTGADRDTEVSLGVGAGINAAFDFYLVGAEVTVQGVAGDVGETSYGQILGRAGLIVNDDVAIYAAGGYGIDLGAPDAEDYLLGAGVELMVNDSVSVRAQYLHGFPATSDGEGRNQFSLGASYHF
jgi:hypothetical protein